jgi:quinoprotein glucose dehydrogenase
VFFLPLYAQNWADYGGSADSAQYSALKLLNKSNVGKLQLAFFHPAPGPNGRFAFSPLVVDGVMYLIGPNNAVQALDAASGKVIWTRPIEGTPTNRGFNYWESKDRSDRRLIFASNNYIQELNPRTGIPITSFGKDGKLNMRDAIPRASQSGTPGRVFENLLILGSNTGEGYGSAEGHLRAYDVITGKLQWIFHTIPQPGEFGYDTWPPDAYKYIGGVNAWGEISIDEKRGIAYFPLGSPTYDLYGADRKGANLFGNTLLALDARTGKRLWHFQAVHHDLWDYDLTTAPKLMTIRHNGKNVDIVAQATKFGFLYVFDRVTGQPIWPIEERSVPKSDVPGEESWPTQPFPTKPPPYSRVKLSLDEINPHLDAAERARLREVLANARNEGVFTPQSAKQDQISIPGELGGTNWGGVAVDPETAMLYVRAVDGPAIHRLRDSERPNAAAGPGAALYQQHCIACHGADRANMRPMSAIGRETFEKTVRAGRDQMPAFPESAISATQLDSLREYLAAPRPAPGTPAQQEVPVRYYGSLGSLWHASNGLPAITPPWSEIVAYDMNQGTIKWRVPLGTVASLVEKGITNTGSYRPVRNGPVVTAGGLIFMATAGDCMIRAYDKDNGKVLWEKEVGSNPDGIPAVYSVGGRQYVAFFAGNIRSYNGSVAWKVGKPEGQGYYVYALPK